MTFEYREPAKVLCDIIQHEMGLAPNQVLIYNQKIDLATDRDALKVTVAILDSKILNANNRLIDGGVLGLLEQPQAAVLETFQIDILSADDKARVRRHEVIMAFHSTYAQQLCEQYQIKITKLPASFVDTSDLEETQIVSRYSMTISVFSLYTKESKAVDYIDDFGASFEVTKNS